ncbi:MAG: NADPH-dependent FMN reductase [Anaerolineae bacterium]
MALIVSVAGSPSAPSRSLAVLEYSKAFFAQKEHTVQIVNLRDLDAVELLHGHYDGSTITPVLAQIAQAAGVILATPVYKASYTGILKAFLDVMPAGALAGKAVLPIALGGSAAHSLVIDYALRPVLMALGAALALPGVYLIDSQLDYKDGQLNGFVVPEAETRLTAALNDLVHTIARITNSNEGA